MNYPIAELIRSRRTIKKFKNEPVELDIITELLEVATWAPNHKMREPWRFIAVVDEGRERLVQWLKEEKERGKRAQPMTESKIAYLHSIPAFVAVVMPVDPRPMIFEEDHSAVSALVQNFQLAAWERGIGMLWNTDSSIYSPEFHKKIGVERGEKIVGLMYIGYPEMTPEARPRTPIEEKLTVISKR